MIVVLLRSMTNIIESICNDKRYKVACRNIAKSDHLSDDLYQEFILQILEGKGGNINKAHEGGYLPLHCMTIIYRLWSHRTRVKLTVGKTSPLFEYTNTIQINDINRFNTDCEGYDVNFDYVSDELLTEIKKDMANQDPTTMYNATVFYRSYFECKNPRQYSKKSKIKYSSVFYTCQEYKRKLLEKFKHILHE